MPPEHRYRHPEVPGVELDWPPFIPIGAMLGAVGVAVASLAQRDALVPPAVDALVALVAVSPWLLEHLAKRPMPRWAFALTTSSAVVVLLRDDPAQTDFAPFLLVIMAAEVGSTGRRWEALFSLIVASVAMVGVELAGHYDGAAVWVAGTLAAGGFGYGLQLTLRLQAQEKARHSDLLDKAALDERQRIAREVHDVIAHSLSVTMLHLTGARRALETGADPAEAADALRDAERLGRQAMNDIRRTVGLLAPGVGGETAPMPAASDIAGLTADFASAGLDVRCDVAGDAGTISLATGLGLYRIAQEALANVAKHAPGATAEVRLDASAEPIRLTVRNTGANGARPLDDAPDVGGLGVQGMEERTRLLGGEFRAGPDDVGGWVVEVSVPREAVEA